MVLAIVANTDEEGLLRSKPPHQVEALLQVRMHRAFGGIWEEDVENQDGDPVRLAAPAFQQGFGLWQEGSVVRYIDHSGTVGTKTVAKAGVVRTMQDRQRVKWKAIHVERGGILWNLLPFHAGDKPRHLFGGVGANALVRHVRLAVAIAVAVALAKSLHKSHLPGTGKQVRKGTSAVLQRAAVTEAAHGWAQHSTRAGVKRLELSQVIQAENCVSMVMRQKHCIQRQDLVLFVHRQHGITVGLTTVDLHVLHFAI
mmetsp:Transcript_28664/g.67371  ORF Transcript_28664/g.67371 Transcript_28664/m.67371 type:complete len:255 (-) Transcript_28664:279-1043(-)